MSKEGFEVQGVRGLGFGISSLGILHTLTLNPKP